MEFTGCKFQWPRNVCALPSQSQGQAVGHVSRDHHDVRMWITFERNDCLFWIKVLKCNLLHLGWQWSGWGSGGSSTTFTFLVVLCLLLQHFLPCSKKKAVRSSGPSILMYSSFLQGALYLSDQTKTENHRRYLNIFDPLPPSQEEIPLRFGVLEICSVLVNLVLNSAQSLHGIFFQHWRHPSHFPSTPPYLLSRDWTRIFSVRFMLRSRLPASVEFINKASMCVLQTGKKTLWSAQAALGYDPVQQGTLPN